MTTLAALPLPEVLWRLAPQTPTCLQHSTVGLKTVSAMGHHFHAWPAQEGHEARFSGHDGVGLALNLVDWAEAQGWTVRLTYQKKTGWAVTVEVPNTFGPLEVRRKGDEALLYAVAGALLMALDIQGGGDGLVKEC